MKRILIVDDTESNLITGKLLEKDHAVSYARDYSEAVQKAGFERFPRFVPARKEDGIDMLLTDLYLPWGTDKKKPHEEDGIHPLGYGLVLAALANGIPYIGMITNQNHHDNAVAATWDYLPRYSPIRTGTSVLGVWDERGCIPKADELNEDLFYQSGDRLITVPVSDKTYRDSKEWKEVKPIKHWHEAARRLLSSSD